MSDQNNPRRVSGSTQSAEDRNGQKSQSEYTPLLRTLNQANLDLFTDRDYLPQSNPENTIILAHIHCLTSTYYLLRHMVNELGIPADNIILLPKPYSSMPSVLRRMQAHGIRVLAPKLKLGLDYDDSMEPYVEDICRQGHTLAVKLAQKGRKARVILVDDGGILTRRWLASRERRFSISTVSIQQTRSGVGILGASPPIPVINVAQSAAKRKFESHYIANAIIEKTSKLGDIRPDQTIGVFGLGMIGRAVAKALLDQGREIYVCDEKARDYDDEMGYLGKLREAPSRKNFIHSCDLIFGATAADWLRDELIPRYRISTEKVLVSCSSRDREFRYILRQSKAFRVDDEDRYTAYNSYADVVWHPLPRQKPFRVLNGGFPINFDRQHEWESLEEIALTRVLVLAAVVQGICTDLASTPADYIQLDPHIQRELTDQWMKFCGKKAANFFLEDSKLADVNWWSERSKGAQPDPHRVVPFRGRSNHSWSAAQIGSGRRWVASR